MLDKLVIILVAIFIFLVFWGKGFGKGKGKGKGNSEGNQRTMPEISISETDETVVEATTTTEIQPTVVEIKYVDVTIREDKYIFAEKEYDLEGLISQLDNLKDGEHVRIYDGGGLQETLDNLINALDEKHIEYLDETNSENSDNT